MSHCLNPHCPHPRNSSSKQFCVTCGTKLLLKDRYRAVRPLGEGGMGRTFLAIDEDTPSKRQCVIKQFSPAPEVVNHPEIFQKAKELFNREAATLDRLGDISKQIPTLLAYLEQDQRLYLVQEFVDGQNLLKELSEQGHYSEAQIQQLMNDLLPVLQLIHQQGLIHRDIKPENVMRRRRDRQLILIDFGLSKELSGTMMAPGTRGGTVGYAPPEQMTYGEAFPASDLYAIGATCIHLLTGEYPYNLYNLREKRWRWREALALRGIRLSETLGQVLDRLLQENYQQRYQSVEEVLAALHPQPAPSPVASPIPSPRSAAPSPAPVASPQPAPSPAVSHAGHSSARSTQRPASNRSLWVGGSIVLLAGLGGYGLYNFVASAPEPPEQEEIATAPESPPEPSEPAKTAEDYIKEGNMYQEQKNYAAALEAFEKAVALAPTSAEAYLERGVTRYYLDDRQQALADYTRAIELNPNYAVAYGGRCDVRVRLNDNQQALLDCNKAIELDSNLAFAYNNRCNVRNNLGDNQQALLDCNKAIELDPNFAPTYNSRGNTYRNLGDLQKALADYNKAIELDSNYASAYYNRGLLYKTSGDTQKARSDFQQAADLHQKQGNTEYYQEALDRLEELK